MWKSAKLLLLAAILLMFLAPNTAQAYIGPGAGFALAGSFFAVFTAFCSALLMLVTWPIRLLGRALFGWRALRRSRVKRVVILGLDGLDHGLTTQMLADGKLPHLAALNFGGITGAVVFGRASEGALGRRGSALRPTTAIVRADARIFSATSGDCRSIEPTLHMRDPRNPDTTMAP